MQIPEILQKRQYIPGLRHDQPAAIHDIVKAGSTITTANPAGWRKKRSNDVMIQWKVHSVPAMFFSFNQVSHCSIMMNKKIYTKHAL